MGIYKFEILNPTTDNKRPFFDNKRGLFMFPVKSKYRYYVECANINPNTNIKEYYFLLSDKKFDEHCRLCHTDNYGRTQIKIKGEIKDFILDEIKYRGNVNVTYLESEDDYDVFKIE